MDKFSEELRKELLDDFGRKVIENVRDRSLDIPKRIVEKKVTNHYIESRYGGLDDLNENEIKIINTLISDTIADTIFYFLSMFEHDSESMRLYIVREGKEYDIRDISEVVGAEITFLHEGGWIQKFSKIDMDN